jgi:hypothetical protein
MRSVKRWPNSPQLTKPHIYFFGGYYRVTRWNHIISTLGLYRDANTYANRLNKERHAIFGAQAKS